MKLERLLELLSAGDPDARDELRRLGAQARDALPALTDAVRSSDPRLRRDAMFVLEGFGPDARVAVPALLEALSGDDDTVAAASDTLGAIGADALAGLMEALDSSQWKVRQGACQGLGVAALGEAVPVLLDRASDEDERDEVATRAVWALGRIGDPSVLSPLAEVLERDGGMRGCWIAELIASFGSLARPCADALLNELHRDDRPLALACASALMSIGKYEEQAVWTLISFLQQGDVDERIEAAMILGEYGHGARAAIASLLAAERDENEDLRAQASIAIAKIRPEYATQT